MRRPSGWEVAVSLIVVTTLAIWLFGSIARRQKPPVLAVTASHDLPANYKLGTNDLHFSIVGDGPVLDPVVDPGEAVGACTRKRLTEDHPVSWDLLTRASNPDGRCASTAMVLRALEAAIEIPIPGSGDLLGGGKQENVRALPLAEISRRLHDALIASSPELDSATESALGEFRSEFVKEFARQLARNAADRFFGRGQSDVVTKDLPGSGSKMNPPQHSRGR